MTRYFGKLLSIDKDHRAVVQLPDDIDRGIIHKYANQRDSTVELDVRDGRTISSEQRKKTFAMLHDISLYTGYTLVETEQVMKFRYMAIKGVEYFSLSNTSVSNASAFIEFLIVFCFKMNIPFKYKTYESIKDSYVFQKRCVLNRKCIICGKPADIDHIKPVGMGRNKKTLDNTQFMFEALCRYHHTMKHNLSNMYEFSQRYHIHIKPIRLNSKQVHELNIGG